MSQGFPTRLSTGKWHFLAVGKAGRDAGREEELGFLAGWLGMSMGGRKKNGLSLISVPSNPESSSQHIPRDEGWEQVLDHSQSHVDSGCSIPPSLAFASRRDIHGETQPNTRGTTENSQFQNPFPH